MSELTDAVTRLKTALPAVETAITNLEAKAAALASNPEADAVLSDVTAVAQALEALAAHDPAPAPTPEPPPAEDAAAEATEEAPAA